MAAPRTRAAARLAGTALGAGLLALAALPLAAAATRLGLAAPSSALITGMGVAVLAALLALGLGIAARGGGGQRRVGLALGLAVLALAGYWGARVAGVPRIHDITTDPANPPALSALVAERQAEGANPHDYRPEVAAAQRAGYPDLDGLVISLSPERAFAAALAEAEARGWRIVATDAAGGRIEASERTLFFGFVDDIVVRVAPAGEGRTRIDVRSISRQGQSDLGVNARRIRAYLAGLRARAGG